MLSSNTRNAFIKHQTLLRVKVTIMMRGGKKAGKQQLVEQ
jgi:hypothetical protein